MAANDLPSYWSSRYPRWPGEGRPGPRSTSLIPPSPRPSTNGSRVDASTRRQDPPTPSRRVAGLAPVWKAPVQRIEDRSPADQAQLDQVLADTYALLRSLKRDR
jgi:hypothetical protein